MPTLLVIKIVAASEWRTAESEGIYQGSAGDKRDGFIHLSAPCQVRETVATHFSARDDLLLVSIDSRKLGDALKWEPSRGGDDFPHLYGALDLKAVAKVEPLPLGVGGRHVFPDWLPD